MRKPWFALLLGGGAVRWLSPQRVPWGSFGLWVWGPWHQVRLKALGSRDVHPHGDCILSAEKGMGRTEQGAALSRAGWDAGGGNNGNPTGTGALPATQAPEQCPPALPRLPLGRAASERLQPRIPVPLRRGAHGCQHPTSQCPRLSKLNIPVPPCVNAQHRGAPPPSRCPHTLVLHVPVPQIPAPHDPQPTGDVHDAHPQPRRHPVLCSALLSAAVLKIRAPSGFQLTTCKVNFCSCCSALMLSPAAQLKVGAFVPLTRKVIGIDTDSDSVPWHCAQLTLG